MGIQALWDENRPRFYSSPKGIGLTATARLYSARHVGLAARASCQSGAARLIEIKNPEAAAVKTGSGRGSGATRVEPRATARCGLIKSPAIERGLI
jgi:hypothetical protein